MTRKVLSLALVIVMVLALVLTGCDNNSGNGSTTTTTTTTAADTTTTTTTAASSATTTTTAAGTDATTTGGSSDLENVTLIWYNRSNAFLPDNSTSGPAVAAYLQEYFLDKINATVEFKWYALADYNTKVTADLTAGQPMDVVFTHNGDQLNFAQWYARNAFLDITDLLPEYAPVTYSSIPEYVWDGASVGGRIFAMPTYKDMCVFMPLIYNKTMSEEQGILEDMRNLNWSFASDVDQLLYDVKEKRDEMHPEWANEPISEFREVKHIYFADDTILSPLVSTAIPGTPAFVGSAFEDGTTAFNLYETDVYRDYIATMTRWVADGIMPYDNKNWDTEGVIKKSGAIFSRFGWGNVTIELNEREAYEQELVQPQQPFTYTGYVQAVMQAISASSKNPERAVMLMELVFSDPQVSTTLRFGIEGTHWNKTEKDGVTRVDFTGTSNEIPAERKDKGGFYLWYHAEQGNLFTAYLPLTINDAFFTNLSALNEAAIPSVNMGFSIDSAPITNELSAVIGVVAEYNPDLSYGFFENYDARIDEFIAKLKANGSEKIVAEAQSQLDAWRAAQ